MPQEQTGPGWWEEGQDVPDSLSKPKTTPSTEYAAKKAVKYGDTKTASVGSRGTQAMAAIVNVFTGSTGNGHNIRENQQAKRHARHDFPHKTETRKLGH